MERDASSPIVAELLELLERAVYGVLLPDVTYKERLPDFLISYNGVHKLPVIFGNPASILVFNKHECL